MRTTRIWHTVGLARQWCGPSNWLRAGVLGVNDGIVSVAGLVVGVAAVTTDRGPMLAAGIAGFVAGAVAMALGGYVSVSTQRDTEKGSSETFAAPSHRYPQVFVVPQALQLLVTSAEV